MGLQVVILTNNLNKNLKSHFHFVTISSSFLSFSFLPFKKIHFNQGCISTSHVPQGIDSYCPYARSSHDFNLIYLSDWLSNCGQLWLMNTHTTLY